MNVEYEVENIVRVIRQQGKVLRWLRANAEKLKGLRGGVLWQSQLDFNELSHSETIKLVRTFGGKWRKTPNVGKLHKVDYTAQIDGILVRSWASAPPPSCRIVEVEVDVPEQIIPAHKEKVRKMVCKGGGEEPIIVETVFAQQPQKVVDG
jgi:hypothetical protein